MSPNFDAYQQVFALSSASNAARDFQGTSEEIQRRLADILPSLISKRVGPGWEVVWGPAVWKHDEATPQMPPDNVWFVARNPSLKFGNNNTTCAYVVAIAATTGKDMLTSYDWMNENFMVANMVNLSDWVDGGITVAPVIAPKGSHGKRALIANGTAQAVHTLMNTLPTGTGQSSLADWLKALEPPAGSRIIFTGHSLGGTLSPTLAVMLNRFGCLEEFGQGCSLVYPTAGATPGNGYFAKLVKALFTPTGTSGTYRVWNQNVVNSLDAIPHVWCTDEGEPLNIRAINTLYGQITAPGLQNDVSFVVEVLCSKAESSGKYMYMPITHSVFPGVGPSVPPANRTEFKGQLVTQHSTAYYKFILGTTNIPKPLSGVTDEDRYASHPLIGLICSMLFKAEKTAESAGV